MAEEMAKVAKDIQAPKGEARLPAAKSPQAAKLLRRSSASTVSPNVAGDLEVMEEDPKAAFRAANDAHQAVQTRRLHSATSMAAVAATTRTRRRSRNRPRNASTIASIPKTPSCWTFWRAFQEQSPGRAHPAESVTIAAYVLHRAVQRDDKREKAAHEIEVSMVEYSLHVQVVLWPCFQHVLAMFSACSRHVFSMF